MKRRFCIVLAVIGLAFPALSAEREPARPGGGPNPEKTVVSRVNGIPITSEAVTDMMNRLGAGTGHGAGVSKGKDALRKEALDRLIFEELAYQKAKTDGLNADPEEVNRRLADLMARMGGEEGLAKALEKQMRTEAELRTDMERDIVLRSILQREVSDKVAVSEEDLAREYEREKDRYVIPEKVVVDDIVFFLNPGERGSVERAGEIRRKVLEDANRNPWDLEPDGTFIVHETEISQEKQGEIYKAAVKMKPGEISGVIETRDSLHVIRLKEYSPRKQLALNEVRGVLQRKLLAEARRERVRQWDAELRKGATIEIVDASEGKR